MTNRTYILIETKYISGYLRIVVFIQFLNRI